jgi:hypothetical protein
VAKNDKQEAPEDDADKKEGEAEGDAPKQGFVKKLLGNKKLLIMAGGGLVLLLVLIGGAAYYFLFMDSCPSHRPTSRSTMYPTSS